MTTVVYECDGKTAVKHITRDDIKTVCGKKLDYQATNPRFYNEHELEKEDHCKKCWPRFNG